MDEEPELDLLLAGTVFFDLVFTGLPHEPRPGTEVWTEGMGSSPGGIANLAVAASRLGLRTALASGFGDDLYADWLWGVLRDQERIDLSYSRRHPGEHTPVTVALSYDDDRAFVTHGHGWPTPTGEMLADPPRTRAVLVDLGDQGVRAETWWRRAAADGALVFATAGWDPAEQWDPRILEDLAGCHAFVPNAVEAMGYTRTASVDAALDALAERVPLAIVTQGRAGVSAIDTSTSERASVPAVPVAAIDTTGAGDVFAAAVVLGTLSGWPLRKRLAFAALCSALAVTQVGGSLAAPGWGDVADWWREHGSPDDGDPAARDLAERYSFLPDCLRGVETPRVRRAEATIARFSDAG
ncbi:carbohydrate kinase family protein [Pseudactinotalea suaedae]|uniref:carbohydrate kinase family protein n=1 Tax=Pseudactinotalea suaedae TaxID=1524924 RepID=UPI0012E226CF|nr:PfkB family carbohydrate kinase [Pseudactinotalea suaedae]